MQRVEDLAKEGESRDLRRSVAGDAACGVYVCSSATNTAQRMQGIHGACSGPVR